MASDPAEGGRGGGVLAAATRRYGPIPAWGWAVLAAGGAYLYIRHRNAAGDGADDTDADTGADAGSDNEAADLASDEASDLAGDFAPPADTASPAAYSGPGSSAKDPIYIDTRRTGPTGAPTRKLRVVTVTKSDDTVAKLIGRYGISLAQLRKDNPHRTWRAHERIKPGTKVHVPGKG
jgi:LysM domain